MKRILALLIMTVLLLAGQVQAAEYGYIEKNGVQMPVRDIYILQDDKNKNIEIYLFPSRLSDQEKQALKSKDAFFLVVNKSSPDRKKWQWYPYAMLRLDSKNGNFNSIYDLNGYYLLAYGIEKQNTTDNINKFAGQEITRYALRGGQLEFAVSGEAEYFKLSWKLDIKGGVVKR